MTEPNTEFAWLIEKASADGHPTYRAMSEMRGAEGYWTTDAYKALRFARQKDAEDVIRAYHVIGAVAVEHGWDNRWHSRS